MDQSSSSRSRGAAIRASSTVFPIRIVLKIDSTTTENLFLKGSDFVLFQDSLVQEFIHGLPNTQKRLEEGFHRSYGGRWLKGFQSVFRLPNGVCLTSLDGSRISGFTWRINCDQSVTTGHTPPT